MIYKSPSKLYLQPHPPQSDIIPHTKLIYHMIFCLLNEWIYKLRTIKQLNIYTGYKLYNIIKEYFIPLWFL